MSRCGRASEQIGGRVVHDVVLDVVLNFTGFSILDKRAPAVELCGSNGVLQMLGDDWSPEGYKLLQRSTDQWTRPNPRPLAQVLLNAVVDGDRVAQQIVREHGYGLGGYALVAARKMALIRKPF